MSNETEQFCVCASRQSHYDKRLILKIVSEVEEGLPRKQAVRIYQLGTKSLDSWLKKYGFSHYQDDIKRKSYSNLQKKSIVAATKQGRMNIREAQTAYAIKGQRTIRDWLKNTNRKR